MIYLIKETVPGQTEASMFGKVLSNLLEILTVALVFVGFDLFADII
jgi:hypothetical protein